MDTSKLKNLVFSGCGILGIAYAGVVQVLEEKGIYQKMTRFAGASAGSIAAFLCALGFNSKELTELLKSTDFRTLLDSEPLDIPALIKGKVPSSAYKTYALIIGERILEWQGLCKGKAIKDWFESILAKKGIPKTVTYSQLYDLTGKDLTTIVCNLSTNKSMVINKDTYPDMKVVDAVHASMSIPIVFRPVTIDKDCCVDGGTTYDYPIDVFDPTCAIDETIGFIVEKFTPKDAHLGHNIIKYLSNLVQTIMNAEFDKYSRVPIDVARSGVVDPCGIGVLEFDITPEQQDILINSGRAAAEKLL